MEESNNPRTNTEGELDPMRVALVGLGKIGFLNDIEQKTEATITHYSALAAITSVSIIAGVDSNKTIREEFKAKTKIKTYGKIDEFKDPADMVVIAAPTHDHLNLVREVVHLIKPQIIVCEKPMGSNSEEAHEIVTLAALESIALYVPYLRRYMPHIRDLAHRIKSKQYGTVTEVSVEYGQGLLVNGSHFVNLVDFLLGGLNTEVSGITGKSTMNPSWRTTSFENAIVKFYGSEALTRSGEIRIRCEYGEFILSHGGIVTYYGSTDQVSGWLEHPSGFQINNWRFGMQDFYSYLLSNCTHGITDMQTDLNSAIRTQEIITNVLR